MSWYFFHFVMVSLCTDQQYVNHSRWCDLHSPVTTVTLPHILVSSLEGCDQYHSFCNISTPAPLHTSFCMLSNKEITLWLDFVFRFEDVHLYTVTKSVLQVTWSSQLNITVNSDRIQESCRHFQTKQGRLSRDNPVPYRKLVVTSELCSGQSFSLLR